jgi:hypothetical protein
MTWSRHSRRRVPITRLVDTLTSTDDALRIALRQAWARLTQSVDSNDESRRIASLDQQIARLRQRMTRATEMFVDGQIDKTGYNSLRDKALADMSALEAELDRLHSTPSIPSLPPLEVVVDRRQE